MTSTPACRHVEYSPSAIEAPFRVLFFANPLPMWILDLKTLHFLEVNDAAVSQYGYSRGEFMGLCLTDILPGEGIQVIGQDLAQRKSLFIEPRPWQHRLKDGRTIQVLIKSHLMEWMGQETALMIAQDITERKRVEDQLGTRMEQLRSLVEDATIGVYRVTPHGHILFANPALVQMIGCRGPEELESWNLEDEGLAPRFLPPVHLESPDDVAKGSVLESAWTKQDGSRMFVRQEWRAGRGEGGKITYFDGIVEDITERKLAQETLEEYEKVVESSKEMVAVVDKEYRYRVANGEFLKKSGLLGAQVKGRLVSDVVGREVFETIVKKHLDESFQGKVVQYEMKYPFPSIGERNLVATYFPIEHHGTIDRIVCISQDVTEQKQAEESIRTSETRFRRMAESNIIGVTIGDDSGRFTYANDVYLQMIGYTRADFELGRVRWDSVTPADQSHIPRLIRKRLAETGTSGPIETVHLHKNGRRVPVLIGLTAIDESESRAIGFVLDLTERERAEKENARLVAAIEQAAEAIVITDTTGEIQYVNPAFTHITAYGRAEAVGKNIRMLKSGKQERGFYEQLWNTILNGRIWHGELTNRRKDGSLYVEEMNIAPVKDVNGRTTNFIAVKQDVTERKSLEDHLHQKAKLEAIGQLAGGVAHDFNNLLTIISGYGNLLKDRVSPEDRGHVTEILNASNRAASLTRQLLTFSRRQILAPQVLDLNRVVGGIEKMLRRLIGEDIEFTTLLHARLGHVMADQGQLEQVIMNLIVNARDAMPNGGKISIETADVELNEPCALTHGDITPGPYVMLAVCDTGTGMELETIKHIFEPFFTTKEKDRGTGLGLATVFGIVKQVGGSICAYSEPGQGTAMKVYLPRVSGRQNERMASDEPSHKTSCSETILVVEDEEAVRSLVRDTLVAHGYKVFEAIDGVQALTLLRQNSDPIDLLLTDVVMPKMNGRELARRLSETRPEIRTLYMSGYTDSAIVHNGILDSNIYFLQKPFTPNGLAQKVRKVLDANQNTMGKTKAKEPTDAIRSFLRSLRV